MNEIDLINRDCPRCGNMKLKNWHQLSDDELVIVKRLPATAQYPIAERKVLHLWCTKCWFESKEIEARDA